MQDLTVFVANHLGLAYSFAVVLTLVLIVEFLRSKRQTAQIDTIRAVQLINREQAVTIDIRPTEAWRKNHIIDSVNIPFGEITQGDIQGNKKLEKYKNKPVILICNTGTEAQKAAALLAKQGYTSYSLTGGLRAWSDAGLPLIKE